jgi:hypothetical protein
MTPPIRGTIHTLTEFPKEAAELTLREALEWWKRCIKHLQNDTPLTPLENKYLNERWAFLVNAVAEREGVPTGSLSYYLAELATAEIRLAEEAALEAEAATSYQ